VKHFVTFALEKYDRNQFCLITGYNHESQTENKAPYAAFFNFITVFGDPKSGRGGAG